jgi:hypothetical protein
VAMLIISQIKTCDQILWGSRTMGRSGLWWGFVVMFMRFVVKVKVMAIAWDLSCCGDLPTPPYGHPSEEGIFHASPPLMKPPLVGEGGFV